MARLHLVRHGEVDNPERILYGRLPGYPLTERGHRMAAMAAERVQPVPWVFSVAIRGAARVRRAPSAVTRWSMLSRPCPWPPLIRTARAPRATRRRAWATAVAASSATASPSSTAASARPVIIMPFQAVTTLSSRAGCGRCARAAVSLAYDDALDSQLDNAIPALDRHGLRATFYLTAGNIQRLGIALLADQAGKLFRAGHVGTFAHVHIQGTGFNVKRFQTGQATCRGNLRHLTWGNIFYRIINGGNMRRGGTTATTGDIDQATFCKFFNECSRFFRGFIITTESIWQACVWMCRNESISNVRYGFYVWTHRICTQRTVKAD